MKQSGPGDARTQQVSVINKTNISVLTCGRQYLVTSTETYILVPAVNINNKMNLSYESLVLTQS